MLVLTSFFLLRQQSFNSSTVLRSLSYSIALSVRQAQVYASSAREFSGNFNHRGYGVYFCRQSEGATCPTQYTLFADVNGNGIYEPATEWVDDFTLGQGFRISKFCAVLANDSEHCSTGAAETLTVYFIRPSPDARFRTSQGTAYKSAYVQVQSPGGGTRSITIYPTGQIEVGELET